MSEPTTMALAIQKAYCRQILQQVEQGCHTLAHLREMAACHKALCAGQDGPQATLDDPYYLGLLDAIAALSKSADLDEVLSLLHGPEDVMKRERDREPEKKAW